MCCHISKRPCSGTSYEPTDGEHIANVFTHAIMIPISIIASIILMVKCSTVSSLLMASVYGICLISLFTVSTAFHIAYYFNSDAELRWRKSDRAVIYLFIAASYSPWLFLLSLPEDKLLVHLRWLIWVLAILGISFELTISRGHPILGIIFYVLYGVVPALVLDSQMNCPGVFELKFSGACYLIGVLFFRSDGIIPFAHAIWHICVILGASVHYLTVYKYFFAISGSEIFNLPQEIK